MIDIFKRPVRRKQDAVGADLEHRVYQRLRAEIPRGRQIEVGMKVVGDLLFRRMLGGAFTQALR